MRIFYASKTGNVRRFIEKTGLPAVDVMDHFGYVTEPYVLVTYTIGFGDVPDEVIEFLEDNAAYCKAVAVSGDRIWGNNFGLAGDTISRNLGIPLIMKFEKGGTPSDVKRFIDYTKGMI